MRGCCGGVAGASNTPHVWRGNWLAPVIDSHDAFVFLNPRRGISFGGEAFREAGELSLMTDLGLKPESAGTIQYVLLSMGYYGTASGDQHLTGP